MRRKLICEYTIPMEKIDILRKRLLYQSQHRGMKEMDLMLGGFAEQALQNMTLEALVEFEEFLAFPDQDLYGWFFEGVLFPEGPLYELIKRINDFIKSK